MPTQSIAADPANVPLLFLDMNQPIKDEGGNYMFVQQLPNGVATEST